MNFFTLAKMRCTTRGFITKSIKPQTLTYILETSRVAPSACNQQPQRIIVVQDKENIKKVEKTYKTFNSPCVLIVCQDKTNPLIRPFDGKCSGDLDIGIVCDHIMLAAREKKLGSVMIGLFDPNIIRAEFGIPEKIEPTALVLLGYPEKGFLSKNRHNNERKPISETIQYERYQNT
jgi:Nitroreductase